MSVFRRLWGSHEKDPHMKERAVEEIQEYQPLNPFTEIVFLQGHTDIVRVLLKIDGKRCVSAADDNSAVIWDIQMGYRLFSLCGHSRPITALLLLLARSHLVTGSSDKQLRIWDFNTGICLKVLTEHASPVRCLRLLGAGSQFCSGGEGLCLWSADGDLLAAHSAVGEENDIGFLISIRNDRVVSAVDKQLVVYTISTGTPDSSRSMESSSSISLVKKLPPHREAIRSLTNIADDTFASGSLDGTIIVWKTDSLVSLRYFNSETEYTGVDKTFPYSIQHMMCLSQRFIIAAVGSGFSLYDCQTGRTLIRKHSTHYSKLSHLQFVCGGLYLATASVDGSIRLWGYPQVVRDARQIDTQLEKGCIQTFLGNSLERLLQLEQPHLEPALLGECLAHSGPVQVLLDCDGESLISCGVDSLIIVWRNENIQMMKRSHMIQTQTPTQTLCDAGIV